MHIFVFTFLKEHLKKVDVSYSPANLSNTIEILTSELNKISNLLAANRLSLNVSKTKLMVISTNRKYLDIPPAHMSGSISTLLKLQQQ